MKFKKTAHQLIRTRADDHRAGFGSRLQAAGDVDRVADHGVFAARPDITRQDRSGVDADSHLQLVRSLARRVRGVIGQRGLQFQRGGHGALGVILARVRRAPHRHHPVAEMFINVTAVRLDD